MSWFCGACQQGGIGDVSHYGGVCTGPKNTPTAEDVMAAVEVARLYREVMDEQSIFEEDHPLASGLRRATRVIHLWLDKFDPLQEGG